MSRAVYKWIIIYDDGTVEFTTADNPADAIENASEDWYSKGVRAIIRMEYA